MDLDLSAIESTEDPILFVMRIPVALNFAGRLKMQESVESVRSQMKKGAEIPWIILDSGASLELIRNPNKSEA